MYGDNRRFTGSYRDSELRAPQIRRAHGCPRRRAGARWSAATLTKEPRMNQFEGMASAELAADVMTVFDLITDLERLPNSVRSPTSITSAGVLLTLRTMAQRRTQDVLRRANFLAKGDSRETMTGGAGIRPRLGER